MKKYYPLFSCLLVFNGILCFYLLHALGQTGWQYIYPLDDTYIHLAIARNFAMHGNWGVVSDVFCSTSSSPVYTFLLAMLIKVFGDSTVYPLIINIIVSNLTVLVLWQFFRSSPVAFVFSFIFLLEPVQLPYIALTGMEHSLHIVLSLLFIILFFNILRIYDFRDFSRENSVIAPYGNFGLFVAGFMLISGILCLTRFEGMFLIVAAAVMFYVHRRYVFSAVTLVVGLLPVVGFGLFSISRGGFFFPNSLMLKGKTGFSDPEFLHKHLVLIYRNLVEEQKFLIPIIFIILILAWRFFAGQGSLKWRLLSSVKHNSHILVVLAVAVCHATFAGFYINFGRYEAYLYLLVYFSLVALIVSKTRYVKVKIGIPARQAIALAIVLLSVSHLLFAKLNYSHRDMMVASRNIYDQQYQMARFLHEYYDDAAVTANDIGAITYFTNIDLLDLAGLGSTEVLKLRNQGQNMLWPDSTGWPPIMQKPFCDYSIIMIYDKWYNDGPEDISKRLGWTRIAKLHTIGNRICADDCVSFYLADPALIPSFRENLRKFVPTLPKEAVMEIY
jgi:hypothetical protein